MSAVLNRNLSDEVYSAPTIAVEIVAPSDLAEDVMDKVDFYLKNGSRLVWIISQQTKTATIYRPDNSGVFFAGD